MTGTNEAWIQDSISRLEQLEAQRERLSAAGRGGTELAELDEEIASLYEVLEAAADNAPSANGAPAAAASASPAPRSVVHPAPDSPFASPLAAAPLRTAPDAPRFDASVDDEPKSNTGVMMAVLAVVLLGGGGAGAWYFTRQQQVAPPPAATGPATIIQGGALPEDTQEPRVAKGGDASRTPTQVIKERPEPDRRPGPRPSSAGTTRPTREKPAKDPSGGIQGAKNNDPLAGLE